MKRSCYSAGPILSNGGAGDKGEMNDDTGGQAEGIGESGDKDDLEESDMEGIVSIMQ